MKKLRSCGTSFCKAWSSIHWVDKSLILFMLLLLGQSACSLFLPDSGTQSVHDIDIIVRTSSASIFGYFLSANFIRRSTPDVAAPPEATAPDTAENGRDGQPFAAGGGEPAAGDANLLPAGQPRTACLQVAVAAGIGLFCLLTLILLRDTGWNESPSATATVVQFRDFVSGCVGFLIGSPTHQNIQTS